MENKQTDPPRIFEMPVHKFRTRVLRFFIRLIKRPLEWISGLRELDRAYARTCKMPEQIPFCDRVLQAVGVRVKYLTEDLERVPKEGPVVVVANHPFGGVEGIILLSLLKRLRPDVKAMANYLLSAIEDSLKAGEKVSIVGFGTFEAKVRPARKGHNPQTRKEIDIPASKLPTFKAGKALKDSLN